MVVLDAKTGHFVTDNARNEIAAAEIASDREEARRELVRSWIAKEAVPLDQAVFGGGVSLAARAFQFVLSRPIVLFGVMYSVNQGLRYLMELMRGKDDAEGRIEL